MDTDVYEWAILEYMHEIEMEGGIYCVCKVCLKSLKCTYTVSLLLVWRRSKETAILVLISMCPF